MAELIERLTTLVREPAAPAGRFDRLALEVFAFQFEHVAPYRRFCAARGALPETLTDWRQVPMVPTSAFKALELRAAPALETFRSSGTQGERSIHHHPFPDLYRATIDGAFPRFCLPGPGRFEMLSLLPPRAIAPDSSLGFMIDHVLATWGGPASAAPVGGRGLEAVKARSWLGARQRAHERPCVVLGTSLALAELLAALERLDLRFRLPAGSVVFDTGGFKARTTALDPGALLERIDARLGVPAARVVREYGMTELTSQCYTDALAGGDRDVFLTPHWVRARVLDPETLEEASPGEAGVLALFDLANAGSAAHLLTQDLAVASGEGFKLVGRAAGAELRGCSLLTEELQGR